MKFFVPPPRANRAPKSLASGSSDSLGRGMDMALTLAVFLLLGWLLDRWLGTAPVFMVVLTVVSAAGQFVRMKYTYDAQMERLEAERLAGGRAATSPLEDARVSKRTEAAESLTMVTQLDGEPVEIKISADIVRRGLIVAPAIIGLAALIWGGDGAYSAGFAIGLVLVNFALSAALISYTARISLGMMMAATLFGYLVRLGLIMLAVLLVKDASWISLPALGATIIVTHLGLLIWELKYVAITLAHPGLKPARP